MLLAALLATPGSACAAPFVPKSDGQVLETLPARAADPRMRAINDLRRALAADPRELTAAVRLARAYYEAAAAEGDPRYVGYAQAALAPWWELPDPPVAARVMRAVLLQFGHQFDTALVDLAAALKQQPANGEAWAWQAAIHMVQTRYAEARHDCEQVAPMASELIATACIASVDSVTGHAAQAVAAIREALPDDLSDEPAESLWALTRVGEIEERLGHYPAAEEAYRRALSLKLTDGYLLAAYSDFLLDRGRPAEVLTLLDGMTRSDLLLLRLALAAKALNDPRRAGWQADIRSRFDAARLRGDTLHQKEESRFALQMLGETARALTLARENYKLQREPADARILLEAAIAAHDAQAAEPVLAWMAESHIESVALQALAQKLKGQR